MNNEIQLFKNAFGECKRPQTSTCIQKTSYETTSLPNFFILDDKDEQPVKIVTEDKCHHLRVKNELCQVVCLVKTDKCLFTSEHKKCDCILFNKKTIYLIELSEAGSRNNKRRAAVSQFEETIKKLNGNGLDLSMYIVKAIICFKSGETKPTQPSFNSKRAEFLRVYKISLEEGNEIVFE